MPDSRLKIFEGSGHMPFRDHPDQFVEIIEQFIESAPPAEHDHGRLGSLMRGDGAAKTVSIETASLGA
jgi:hypothetical protein